MAPKYVADSVHGSAVAAVLMFWLYPKKRTSKVGLSLTMYSVGYFGVPSGFMTSYWWSRLMIATSASPERSMNSRVAMSFAFAIWTSRILAGVRQYVSKRSRMITWFGSQTRNLK